MIKYIDLFCGIGGFRLAMQEAATRFGIWAECAFSSDIDEECRRAYFSNFLDTPQGDITALKTSEIPDHDILLAGFPCQPFSIIGDMKGFDDTRGTLFFDIARILKDKKPKAFVLENVKLLVGHNQGHTLSRIIKTIRALDYECDYKVLNALDFGLPQKRERVFIVGIRNPKEIFEWPIGDKSMRPLKDILEDKVPAKFFASPHIRARRKAKVEGTHLPPEPNIWHENKGGNVGVHPFSCALRAGASYNYLLVNGERRLTSREMLRLQGFPEDFKIVCNDSQTRKQAGNSLPVPVASHVIGNVLRSIGYDAKDVHSRTQKRLLEMKGTYDAQTAKLRSVEKYNPPYPLHEFPADFSVNLGREIVYLLATRGVGQSEIRLEGSDWEEIFAGLIGAEWKPSNVGLDDVVLEQTAWGAKTIKSKAPFKVKKVRLISGRNSPVFSYGDENVSGRPPNELGGKILEIYNERVAAIRQHYKHLRTVVLIKGPGLLTLSIFEFDTVMYDLGAYSWTWNNKGNLEGREIKSEIHKFTWQPHGSQFTIIENVPNERLSIRIKRPVPLDKEGVLKELKFDESWIEIVTVND